MLANRIKNESGYTLIEVMVSILILAIAIIPMVGMFDMGLKSATKGSTYDQARALANQNLEMVRALNYSTAVSKYTPGTTPNCGSPPPASSSLSCSITTTYVDTNLQAVSASNPTDEMQVDVTVTWAGGSNSYTTTGLIARGSS